MIHRTFRQTFFYQVTDYMIREVIKMRSDIELLFYLFNLFNLKALFVFLAQSCRQGTECALILCLYFVTKYQKLQGGLCQTNFPWKIISTLLVSRLWTKGCHTDNWPKRAHQCDCDISRIARLEVKATHTADYWKTSGISLWIVY